MPTSPFSMSWRTRPHISGQLCVVSRQNHSVEGLPKPRFSPMLRVLIIVIVILAAAAAMPLSEAVIRF